MEKIKIIRVTLPFILFLLISPALTISIPKPTSHQAPDIWLSGFTKIDTAFRVKAPETQFRSHVHFKNDFISKNNNDYVISSETRSAVFTCEADYPITWTFPSPEQLDHKMYISTLTRETRISKFSPDKPNPVNIRFKIVISVHTTQVDFMSVNLTCNSVENKPDGQSSVYIFMNGKSNIENEGKTLNVSAEAITFIGSKMTNPPPLLFPCRPASPDVKLSLEKQHITWYFNGTQRVPRISWSPIRFSDEHLTFNPKIGFALRRGLLGNRIFGVWRCSVVLGDDSGSAATGDDDTEDSDQFVLINVTRTTKSVGVDTATTFEPRSILRGKASVDIQASDDVVALAQLKLRTNTIVCCSGVKNKPPKIYMHTCANLMGCQLLKKFMVDEIAKENGEESLNFSAYLHTEVNGSTDCQKSPLIGASLVIMCKGETVDYADQYINMFHPQMEGPVANRSKRIQEADLRINPSKKLSKQATYTDLSRYETLADAENAYVPQKMVLMVGKDLRKRTLIRIQSIRSLGLPIHFTTRIDNLLEPDPGAVDDDIMDLESLAESLKGRVTYTKEYDRDAFYEGESLTFMCFGVRLFYAGGSHLRLNWKNGTKTLLETGKIPPKRSQIRRLYISGNSEMFEGWGGDLVAHFGFPMIARQGMSSVDCWMPVSNSSRWDKISKSVQVLPTVAPTFVEMEEESIYFYLGDVGKSVTCTVHEGVPFPRLKVFRDGRRLPFRYDMPKNAIKKALERGPKNATIGTESEDKDKHLIHLNIDFPTITHDLQIELKCIATNVNGTVTRTVKVFVIERPSIALPICLSIAGVLCLIAIALGVKHWHDKRTMSSLRMVNV